MLMIYRKKFQRKFSASFLYLRFFAVHVFIFVHQVVQVSKSKRGGKGQGLQTAEREKSDHFDIIMLGFVKDQTLWIAFIATWIPKVLVFLNVFWIFMFSENFVQQTLLSITKYPLELVFQMEDFVTHNTQVHTHTHVCVRAHYKPSCDENIF